VPPCPFTGAHGGLVAPSSSPSTSISDGTGGDSLEKKMEKKSLSDYGIDGTARLKVVKVEEPPQRKGGGKVDDVDGMIKKLKELGAL